MIPKRIQGATRYLVAPAGWKPEKDGACGHLAVLDTVTDLGTPVMISAWEPTPEELAKLNAGGSRTATDCSHRASTRVCLGADMSSEALAWAFKQECPSSSVKFTLVALCECANYQTGCIFPSVAHITEITGQNRKTIIANIAELERLGFIVDTGERAGTTRQIKVYRAVLGTVPKAEQSRERNSSENVRKESQKRDTEPSRTFVDKAKALPTKRATPFRKPDGVDQNIWNDFLDLRKAKRAPLSNTALEAIEREAAKAGWSMNDAITECVARGWQSFKASWVKDNQNGQHGNQTDGLGRTERAAERLKQQISGGGGSTRKGSSEFGSMQSRAGNRVIDAKPDPLRALGHDG